MTRAPSHGIIALMRALVLLVLAAGCSGPAFEVEDSQGVTPIGGAAGLGGAAAGGSETGGQAGQAATGGTPAGGQAGQTSTGGTPSGGAAGAAPGGQGGTASGGIGGGACVPKTFEEICSVNECGMYTDGCSSIFQFICGSCAPATEACEAGQCVETACKPKTAALSGACADNTPGTPVLWTQCGTQPDPACTHTLWVTGSNEWCCPS